MWGEELQSTDGFNAKGFLLPFMICSPVVQFGSLQVKERTKMDGNKIIDQQQQKKSTGSFVVNLAKSSCQWV